MDGLTKSLLVVLRKQNLGPSDSAMIPCSLHILFKYMLQRIDVSSQNIPQKNPKKLMFPKIYSEFYLYLLETAGMFTPHLLLSTCEVN